MLTENKDKMLLITLDFPPLLGGVANYYFNRVKQMSKDEIVVLMNQSNNYQLPPNSYNFKIINKSFFVKFIWPHWLPLIWHISKIVKKEKINKIWAGQILPVGTAVWLLSKILNIPYFITCHGNDLLRAKNSKRKFKLAKKILKDTEFVEANSEFTKNILINDFQIPSQKITVVYPISTLKKEMVNEQKVLELRKKYNLENKKVLITVARLVESKGVGRVLEALPQVWEKMPELVYIIVGDGPHCQELLKISAKFSQTNDKIIFVGAVPQNELSNYYALADAFILTPCKNLFGDTESFGIVYLEAKEFGLPIIAGNVGGALEIAKDYNQMHLLDSENNNEVINKIIEIMK